jgi:hypothetical protein
MASAHDSSATQFSADSFSAEAGSFALGPPRASASGKFWLNGEVAGCQCPECGGPMSIRLWLLTADCALCGTSLELTVEQERELQALIQQHSLPPPPPPPTPKPAAVIPAPPKSVPPLKPQQQQVSRPAEPKANPTPVKAKTPDPQPTPPPKKPEPPAIKLPPIKPVDLFAPTSNTLPGKVTTLEPVHDDDDPFRIDWLPVLISTIFHVLLVMFLALLSSNVEPAHKPPIILTATWGNEGKEGDKKQSLANDERTVKIVPGLEKAPEPKPQPPEPPKPVALDKPPPKPPAKVTTPEVVALDFRPSDFTDSKLPQLAQLQQELASTDGSRMSQGRDPRLRSQLVIHEGGTIHSEAAVANGLRWLSRHQSSNGSWSLNNFHGTKECNGRCRGVGGASSDTAATGLALLPFLGASQTPNRGIYNEHVKRGLAWLVNAQKSDGDLRSGNGNMYSHGIAAIALCEAYMLTKDEKLRGPAQKSLDFIVKAQDTSKGRRAGGWRYSPNDPGDLSVVGWQLMALQSGRHAGLTIPETVFERAAKFLDSVQAGEHGGLYSYMPNRSPEDAMIAEGLLCREYLGWPATHPGLVEGSKHMLKNLPAPENPNIYYWYYATQAMHHLGGKDWETWNNEARDTLIAMQSDRGHEAGSWDPLGGAIGGHDTQAGGRLYMTSLAICTLEVYYRHLPIYRRIELATPEK